MSLLTLREFRSPIITAECRACDRYIELDRKTLVRQYGASIRFVELRRRLAVGCEKMICADGEDRCQTRFPCLLEANLTFEGSSSDDL
ncbi:hypothetical protein QO002_005193 [Pararhizobium capsulatum DSM 1112]|uniref:CopZ zinc binding domain-containing protein n=1 Tax=Pararhizobium capsulatum DSM 1112 TaxID=1121113 RepID=A0ABU0C1K4_9HYPH|nr:hypothetical protein [Pararhizobium capsulatum DSM 1112]